MFSHETSIQVKSRTSSQDSTFNKTLKRESVAYLEIPVISGSFFHMKHDHKPGTYSRVHDLSKNLQYNLRKNRL